MDVELPDGTVVEGVPDGFSQAQLVDMLAKAGHDTSWYAQPEAPSLTDRYLNWQKENVGAVVEPALQMGSGLVGSVAGGLAGLATAPFTGANKAAEVVRNVQGALTYEPSTTAGKAVSGAMAYPFEKSSEGWGKIGGAVGQAVGGEKGRDVGESLGGVVVPIASTLAGYKPMVTGAEAAAQSVRAANMRKASAKASARIEELGQAEVQSKYQAAKDLMEAGGVVNPADVNPAWGVQTKAKLADSAKLREEAASKNAPVVISMLKKELGLADDAMLDSAALNAVREQAAEASNTIRNMGAMTDTTGIIDQLESLRPNPKVLGQKTGAKKANDEIDAAIARVQSGMAGADVIDSISTLRRDARATFNRSDLKPKDRRVAEVQQGVADALEALVERNISDPALLQRFREGRTLQAKTYVIEDLMTPTGAINIQGLLKGAPAKANLTGELAKLKNIAAHFPATTGILPSEIAGGGMRMYRTGHGGTAGAALGAPFGAPVSTGILGTIAEGLYARRLRSSMLSPEYQAANVLPEVTGLFSPVKVSSPPLSLAPLGPLPSAPAAAAPITRGMLSLEDTASAAPRGAVQAAGLDMPLQPRLGPLYSPTPRAAGLSLVPEENYPPSLRMPVVEPNAPQPRGMLGVTEYEPPLPPNKRLAERHDVPTNEFMLKLEVLQQPAIRASVEAFINESERLKMAISKGGGMFQKKNQAALNALEDEFAAGMKQLGVRDRKDALGLVKLYEGGGLPRLRIEKTRGLR